MRTESQKSLTGTVNSLNWFCNLTYGSQMLGNFKTKEPSFIRADVDRLARNALKRSKGNVGRAQMYAQHMADHYESYKWEQVVDRISELAHSCVKAG